MYQILSFTTNTSKLYHPFRKKHLQEYLISNFKKYLWSSIDMLSFERMYAGIRNYIIHLTLSLEDFWVDDFWWGAKKPALHIRAISQSFHFGLDCYQKQMWNPHNEAPFRKKICKFFENWPSNHNFCSPYKNSETSKKNQERAFFGHFWIATKKNYFIQIFKPGQNIMCLLNWNIQIPPPLSADWQP